MLLSSETLSNLGLVNIASGDLVSISPIDGSKIGYVNTTKSEKVKQSVEIAQAAFVNWRQVPAPKRGELIRIFAQVLRENKEDLAKLVTVECGKIIEEGRGEVQEMIDICDFAVGLSRQLYGLTIASERPGHRMMETWHPLGVVAVISAFNFPVAVWAWNFAISVVCGNSVIWKPSEKTPLCAFACQHLFEQAMSRCDCDAPFGLSQVIIGDRRVGESLVENEHVSLVSATGSSAMGRIVGPKVAARFGRSLLELGGNNAMIVAPSADLDMAVRSIVFSAVGTAGQRCTSLRRVIAHTTIYDQLLSRLKTAYASINIGNPMDEGVLVGPLIDEDAFIKMHDTLQKLRPVAINISGGDRIGLGHGGYYVDPAIVELEDQNEFVKHETFAPILYMLRYDDLDHAILMHNDVPQGLSSAIFTMNIREAEKFISSVGSDCGIANVNIGPSGAEIGGAFGGEKETGGGRESGSDAWKSYMRRATNTINYSAHLPLSQGIKFELA